MWWLAVTLLAAAPGEAKLAAPPLRLVDISKERGAFYTEQLAIQMGARGLRVVTEREIAVLLGLERQRQLLGCSEDSTSCLVELANALGVDGVLLGDVAKVGSRFQVSLRVVDAKTSGTLGFEGFKAADEEELVDGLERAAAGLALQVRRALGREAPAGPGASISRSAWWVPAAGAAVALGGGALCLGLSRGDYARLDPLGEPRLLPVAEAQATAQRGQTLQTVSMALFAAGGAAVVGTLGVLVFGADAQLSAAATPSGASIGIAGRLP